MRVILKDVRLNDHSFLGEMMYRLRLLSLLATCLCAAPSYAIYLVNTDFESSINTLGVVNGQAANGPNPWTSSGATVVNTGPVLGFQALNYTSTLAPGQFDHHSRINLTSTGGITIPTGFILKASVDIYSDPNEPGKLAGLSMWANSHANEHSIFVLEGGNAFAGARHGSGPTAPILGHVSNPPYSGWHTISLLVTQTSANTLTTTYQMNNSNFTYNGAIYNSHVDTIGIQNLVFDFSLVTWNPGSTSQAVTGIYDNYRVELVPEPATMVAATFGIVGLFCRRRRLQE